MRFAILCLLASTLLYARPVDDVPVFTFVTDQSSVQFSVKASSNLAKPPCQF